MDNPVPTIPVEVRTKAKSICTQARMDLALDYTFFGALVLQLQMVEKSDISTAGTDGKHIFYNPAYFTEHGYAVVKGILCHEALHCAFEHVWRENDLPLPPLPKDTPKNYTPEQKDEIQKLLRHEKANRAADYAINPIVLGSGLKLPSDVLVDAQYTGKPMEEIYRLLPESEVQFISGSGGAVPKDAPRCGDILPQDGASEDGQQQQQQWKGVVSAAVQAAKNRGHLPAGLEDLIDKYLKPQVDFRSRLRRLVQCAFINDDYTWRKPNRRFVPHGLYMPSMFSERVGTLAIGQDTSGSMWDKDIMTACGSEIRAIVEDIQPSKTMLYYCDAAVASTKEFAPGDPFEFVLKGGGGTSFVPVFTQIAKDGLEPSCLIYLTDLQGEFPETPPPYPVIWVTVCDGEAPFGEVVKIDVRAL